MNIVAISGSNRVGGATYNLLRTALDGAEGVQGRILQVAEVGVMPCELCFERCAAEPFECALDDGVETIVEALRSADGIVIASPFYFYVPSKLQALLERLSCLDYFTKTRHGDVESPVAGKPCALICLSASGSTFNAFQVLHHLQEFALMFGMRPVHWRGWPYIGLPAKSGELDRDAVLGEKETLANARELIASLATEIRRSG